MFVVPDGRKWLELSLAGAPVALDTLARISWSELARDLAALG